jgi:prophage tail gpP-like protein
MPNDVPVIEHKPAVPGVALKPAPQRLFGNKEIATLRVRGVNYTNWTSIRIEQRAAQAFPVFQFECTEESPMPVQPSALAFVPGDVVQAFIGGAQVLFGYITERHVGFDATNHGVRLIGTGDTSDLVNTMVPVEKLGPYENMNWAGLFHEITSHLGTKLTAKNIDLKPYEQIQIQPGDSIMSALERYALPRNIVIGSVATGGILALGEHPAHASGTLTEGVDILRANAVTRDDRIFKRYTTLGQANGSDKSWGAGQNQQRADLGGTSTRNRHNVTVLGVADSIHGVQRRVKMEYVFSEGAVIEAQITVQGWYKNSNQSDEIWRAGEYYRVNSPSLLLNDLLGCQSCVYEQNDASGTTTTLTMVRPIHLNGVGLASEVQRGEQELMRRRLEEQSGAGAGN